MEINNKIGGLGTYGLTRLKTDKAEKPEGTTDGHKAEGSSPASGDRISLSQDARLMATAMSAAHGAPEVRAARVAELKAQVEAGTYNPDSRITAAAMVQADLDILA